VGIFEWRQVGAETWVIYKHVSRNTPGHLWSICVFVRMQSCNAMGNCKKNICIGDTLVLTVGTSTRALLELKEGSIRMLIQALHKAEVQHTGVKIQGKVEISLNKTHVETDRKVQTMANALSVYSWEESEDLRKEIFTTQCFKENLRKINALTSASENDPPHTSASENALGGAPAAGTAGISSAAERATTAGTAATASAAERATTAGTAATASAAERETTSGTAATASAAERETTAGTAAMSSAAERATTAGTAATSSAAERKTTAGTAATASAAERATTAGTESETSERAAPRGSDRLPT